MSHSRSARLPRVPESLLSLIYRAASDASHWPHAVADLTSWVGAAAGGFQTKRLGPNPAGMRIIAGMEERFLAAYEAYYLNCDPHLTREPSVGSSMVSRQVLPHADLKRTEYFNDFFRPQGLADLQGAVLLRNQDWLVSLVAYSEKEEGFDEETLARFDALIPHLTRALRLSFAFERPLGPGLDLANQMRLVGVLQIDRELRVLHGAGDANTVSVLEDAESPLQIAHHRVRARCAGDQSALEHAVRRAVSGEASSLILSSAFSRLELGVAPGPRAWPLACERSALLVFSPRQARSAPCFRELPRALQPVAGCLAQGMSDKEIATVLGLSLPTARTYVSRVMKQLGVHDRRRLITR